MTGMQNGDYLGVGISRKGEGKRVKGMIEIKYFIHM
jgi:hypothetical protein